jgi:hypothetical protein
MKAHLTHGAIAAAIAGSMIVGGDVVAPRHITQVTHSVQASKHAWPDLSGAEVDALAAALAPLKGKKVIILCGDAACTDLAQDIDDAMETAGVDSLLDRPALPLGYGIGVAATNEARESAVTLAAAIRNATQGRYDPPVTENRDAGEYLILGIGKHKR